MSSHVPAHCHGSAAPFATFSVQQHAMPGFIEPVLQTAVEDALTRQGLVKADAGTTPDVTANLYFTLIDRNPPPQEVDPMGDPVSTSEITRFVAHVDMDVVDNRDGKVIWKATMERYHAILGGETFHDDRALLIVSSTLDQMFEGLTSSCE